VSASQGTVISKYMIVKTSFFTILAFGQNTTTAKLYVFYSRKVKIKTGPGAEGEENANIPSPVD
jgi:hypothetical protein